MPFAMKSSEVFTYNDYCVSDLMKQSYHSIITNYDQVVILDRDGVINIDYGYVSNIEDIDYVDGIFSGLRYLQEKKYDIFIATNQSGVARSFYSEDDVKSLHLLIDQKFKSEGVMIGGFLYCPHHLDGLVDRYKKSCYWRKPMPGMVKAILSLKTYNNKTSFLIGDNDTDVIAAESAGIRGFKFSNGNIFNFIKKITYELDKHLKE